MQRLQPLRKGPQQSCKFYNKQEINNTAADIWLLPGEAPPADLLLSCEPLKEL